MPSTDQQAPTPSRARPRVLFVGRDRRYMIEAARRLRGLGLEVASTCRPSEIVDLVERLELNVAVVDGSHYLAATARSIAAIDAAARPVATITVVDDALLSPLSQADVMPKWASLARLADHVEETFRPFAHDVAEVDLAVA
jgi:hypothetical protein